MRAGLDPEKIRERAVERIYQQWRSSETGQLLKTESELYLQDSVLRTPFHHHFRKHLAKDFILYTDTLYPRVSVEFADGDYLWASVQVETSPGVRNLWQGYTRLVNNGFLTGVWLAGLLLLAGMGLWMATTLFLGFSLLWASHWNPLFLPEFIYERSVTGLTLLRQAFSTHVFDKDSLAFALALLSIFMFVIQRVWRRRFKFEIREVWRRRLFLLSLLTEPLIVCVAFSLYEWSAQEKWWSLYLMSWVGRFFSVPFLVHHFYFEGRDPRWKKLPKLQERPMKLFPLALLIPAFFYFSMGWDWLVVMGSSLEAPVLMGFKVFATAFLVGLVMGSRFFALAFGLLVFPLMLGTKASALDVAFMLGIYLDGMLLGWIISPWMMGMDPWRLLADRRIMALLVSASLAVGLMLSSVGIPYVVPWVLLVMVVWGFYNLNRSAESA